MFKKLIFNKTLIFILVFTILFNFITIPKKVSAEAITMSYGLYVFLQAAYAAGLTYIVADRVTKDGMKLYQEWQKFNENKPDPPDDDGQRNAIANLLGLGLLDSFGNLVDSVKDFFKSMNSKEGENFVDLIKPDYNYNGVYTDFYNYNFNGYPPISLPAKSSFYNVGGNSYKFTFTGTVMGPVPYSLSLGIEIENGDGIASYKDVLAIPSEYRVFGYGPGGSINNRLDFDLTNDSIIFYLYYKSGNIIKREISLNYPPYVPISEAPSITYNITNNSYILTDDKNDIKKMSPNIDILPQEKLETIATPEGYYKKYIGDDLVDDYIESIPKNFPGDLFKKTPGEFVETDYGIIFVPEGRPVPSPKPIPSPDPDPKPDPGPKPEYPDTFPTDPYPEIVEEDVEIPKGLGKIIALLKELVNWSSRIFNKEEIDKDLEPDKPGLFEIPGDLELDLDPLKNLAIVEKFPFSLPWDLKNAVNLLVSPAQPPSWEVPIYKEKITIDLAEFESLAFISRSFFTILFIIALVIATRRFIGGA